MTSDDRPPWFTAHPIPSSPAPLPPREWRDQVQGLTRMIYLLVLVNLVSLAVIVFLVQRGWAGYGKAAPTVTPRGELADDEKSTIQLYNNVRPSVVHITTLIKRRGANFRIQSVPRGTGSGFIWDKEGHVVTNYHVIKGANQIQVTLKDGTSYDATVVGTYKDKDLAVLQIHAPPGKLLPIQPGTSDDLQVGQKVYAIGNPFGLDQTLTKGIISALGRELESQNDEGETRTIKNMIQTDAAINPGNSGGPLLDSSGRLIGVNTAIYSPSGASAGIGFAIPVDEVTQVVPQLIKSGKVTRPSMGVHVFPDQIARQLRQTGVVIAEIIPGGPAEKAGLQATTVEGGQIEIGDVIVAIDEQPVLKVNDLAEVLSKHKVGDKIKVTVQRDDKKVTVEVTLAPSPVE